MEKAGWDLVLLPVKDAIETLRASGSRIGQSLGAGSASDQRQARVRFQRQAGVELGA